MEDMLILLSMLASSCAAYYHHRMRIAYMELEEFKKKYYRAVKIFGATERMLKEEIKRLDEKLKQSAGSNK